MMPYLHRAGIALDILLNVLFGGMAGQTISLRAAIAAARGSRPACVVCAFLSAVVEAGHCAKQLTPGAEPAAASVRAGALLLALASAPFVILHWIF
jgi:hypothetical protein